MIIKVRTILNTVESPNYLGTVRSVFYLFIFKLVLFYSTYTLFCQRARVY